MGPRRSQKNAVSSLQRRQTAVARVGWQINFSKRARSFFFGMTERPPPGLRPEGGVILRELEVLVGSHRRSVGIHFRAEVAERDEWLGL